MEPGTDAPGASEGGEPVTDTPGTFEGEESGADTPDASNPGEPGTDAPGTSEPSDIAAADGGSFDADISDAPSGEEDDPAVPDGEATEDPEEASEKAGADPEEELSEEEISEEIFPETAVYAAGQGETLQLAVTPGELESGTLTLTPGAMSFAIDPGISGTTVDKPILVIKIPDIMQVTSYLDDKLNNDCMATPNASDSIHMTTSGGYTVLTYEFKANKAWVNFGIEARIPDGIKVKDGQKRSIIAEYYDGSKLLNRKTISFTTKNPTATVNYLSLDSFDNASFYLEPGQTQYDVDSDYLLRTIRSTEYTHYPFDSITLTSPLPPEAVPYIYDYGSSAYTKKMPKNQPIPHTWYDSQYTVTYNGSALVYKLTSGDFLSRGSSCTFYSDDIVLRYTNPSAKTYTAAGADTITCVVDGKSITIDSGYKSYVTFKDYPAVTVDPYEKWENTITLKADVTAYDTTEYIRHIHFSTSLHRSYDAAEMTVPLPAEAVPGFGTGDSFSPLPKDEPQTVSSSYGTWTVTYTGSELVYRLEKDTSGYFLSSGSSFTFSGYSSRKIYLRFTDPKPGTYKALSPTIKCFVKGQEVLSFTDKSPMYANYPTVVTVYEPPKDSGLYSDFDADIPEAAEPKEVGWKDEILLEDGKTVYDTKMYDRAIYSSKEKHYYPYENVKMTVLLPNEAIPGIGTGNSFVALEDGKQEKMSPTWAVTYYESYNYSSDTASGTSKALVYEILPGADFLTSGKSFSFTTTTPSRNLYLRFENQTSAAVYTSAGSPNITYTMNGTIYLSKYPYKPTQTDTSVTFKERSVQWSGLKVSYTTNTTPYTRNDSCVLAREYQNDKVYEGYVTNQTGFALQNVTVKYTFDPKLYADRLTFHPGENGCPSTAQVVYTTSLHPEETTVTLNAGSNVLSLEEGDALLTAVVTYDALGRADAAQKLMTANIHNYERLQDASYSRIITAEIQSAECDRDNGESEKTFDRPSSASFQLVNALYTLNAVSQILMKDPATGSLVSAAALDKGDSFVVRCYTHYISSLYYDCNKYQNLSLYLRMPKGYLLTGYAVSVGADGDSYVVDNRTLENGEILYRVEYTDRVLYNGGYHDFQFKIGPEADTFERNDIPLPTAAYAAVEKDTLFQFPDSSMKSEQDIGLDVNGDGDMEDRFYPLNTTTVEIRPFGDMSVEGYLTSTDQVGENIDSKYNLTSEGNYRLYLYNGIASGAIASGAEIVITLPRIGHEFADPGTTDTDTAQWDALLTDSIKLTGTFLEGAEVSYSPDREGDTWLTADQLEPEKLKSIVRIRVKTASDKQLSKAESAILDVPFTADFLNSSMKEDGTAYLAYIGVYGTYHISGADGDKPQPINKRNTLEAAPLEFSGTVFHDKNGNLEQDEYEFIGNACSLSLYSGEGTDGEQLQSITTKADGSYTFGILLPGTYTLHVEKEEAELYEYLTEDCVFDENGNYVIRLSADEKPQTKNLDLGLVTPRILSADTDPVTLLDGMTHKLTPSLTPPMSKWENDNGKAVSFESSDPSVVTADGSGLLHFAGEGRATVTITAPQLEAVLQLCPGTPEWLTAEVPVVTELPPPVFTVSPKEPDGDNGWYITKPLVTLLPGTTADYVTTLFRDQEDAEDTYRAQTSDHRPTIDASGLYSFSAYNIADVAAVDPKPQSKTAGLETLKVDLIAPTILTEQTTFSPTGVGLLSDVGRFLTFGNFFKEAIRVTVQAEDGESGVGTLYYILPGQEVRSADIARDGSCYFDVPLDTNGRVIYYVSDKAGNLSDEVVLQKDEGPDLWVIEDRPPLWEPFDMKDGNGDPGVQGADGNIWFAGTAEVTARVSDEDSGLAAISVQIDEGIPEIVHFGILSPVASIRVVASARTDIAARAADDEPTTPPDTRQYYYMLKTTVEAEGLHILYAEAEDNARNVSSAETALGIDMTAPALTLENSYLSGDTPYASVLVTDLGSGVDPGTILITWREQTIAGTVEAADGGYRILFQLPTVSPGDTDNLLQVEAADYVGHESTISVECPVKSKPADPGPLDQVPKTGEGSDTESNTMRLDRTEALTATRKKDEQDGEDEGLRQA